jgi:magnesium-transporting ATPase (P-type)
VQVVCIFALTACGTPAAFTPLQLLWVNLVTDGLPATALAFNASDAELLMRQPPRPRAAPLVSGTELARYLLLGGYIAAATSTLYVCWWLLPDGPLLEPLSALLRSDGHTAVSWSQLSNWASFVVPSGGEPSPVGIVESQLGELAQRKARYK